MYSSESPHLLRLCEAILMSTHTICLYGEIWKVIPKISPNAHKSVPLTNINLELTGILHFQKSTPRHFRDGDGIDFCVKHVFMIVSTVRIKFPIIHGNTNITIMILSTELPLAFYQTVVLFCSCQQSSCMTQKCLLTHWSMETHRLRDKRLGF